jgi:hypothetical protein
MSIERSLYLAWSSTTDRVVKIRSHWVRRLALRALLWPFDFALTRPLAINFVRRNSGGVEGIP